MYNSQNVKCEYSGKLSQTKPLNKCYLCIQLDWTNINSDSLIVHFPALYLGIKRWVNLLPVSPAPSLHPYPPPRVQSFLLNLPQTFAVCLLT